MTIDLKLPGALKLLAKSVLEDIDAAAIALYREPIPRRHLGASLIGDECSRKLWYGFRWVAHKLHEPRTERLFNRGHKEEARFTEWLEKAGYRVLPLDPSTGKQWRIEGVGGHFGGSCDGIAYLPPKYEIEMPMLLEYKTNGTGPGFNKLISNGCAIEKPVHFDQQNVYGFKLNLSHSIYLNVCKNDDNIYSEVIKLNIPRGADLEKKAEVIIRSQTPPEKIANSPAYSHCAMCDFKMQCHQGVPFAVNCRSCKNASPQPDKAWHCALYGTIPDDVIPKGCPQWEQIA